MVCVCVPFVWRRSEGAATWIENWKKKRRHIASEMINQAPSHWYNAKPNLAISFFLFFHSICSGEMLAIDYPIQLIFNFRFSILKLQRLSWKKYTFFSVVVVVIHESDEFEQLRVCHFGNLSELWTSDGSWRACLLFYFSSKDFEKSTTFT